MKKFEVKLFNLEEAKDREAYSKLMTEAFDPAKEMNVVTTYFIKTFTSEEKSEDGYSEKISIQQQWVRCEIVTGKTEKRKRTI